jgi:hypothetical protein
MNGAADTHMDDETTTADDDIAVDVDVDVLQ